MEKGEMMSPEQLEQLRLEQLNAIGFWVTFFVTFGSLLFLFLRVKYERWQRRKTQSNYNYAIWGLMDNMACEVDRMQRPKNFAWWIVQHAKETTIEPHNMARGMRQLAGHISHAETKQIILDYAQQCDPVVTEKPDLATV